MSMTKRERQARDAMIPKCQHPGCGGNIPWVNQRDGVPYCGRHEPSPIPPDVSEPGDFQWVRLEADWVAENGLRAHPLDPESPWVVVRDHGGGHYEVPGTEVLASVDDIVESGPVLTPPQED